MIDGLTFYKTLFIVPDLRTAARRFNALSDFDWREVPAAPHPFQIGDTVRELTHRAVISAVAPRIHLIEESPGTPWRAAIGGAAHHVSYWVDDLTVAHETMLNAGFTVEACDVNPDQRPRIWAYYLAPEGTRIELLDSGAIPGRDAFVASLPRFTLN